MRLGRHRTSWEATPPGMLLQKLAEQFPAGSHYWVEGLAESLRSRLLPADTSRSPQGLWGAQAEAEVRLGRMLGWVPDGEALVFFAPTVAEEVARSLAVAGGSLAPSEAQVRRSTSILEGLGIAPLAERAPDRLSDGETKLLWTAIQVAKAPRWLALDSLTASLSGATAARLAGFLASLDPCPILLIDAASAPEPPAALGRWQTVPLDGEGLP